MKRCSAKPYEGDEKYIFVSYCHKDKAMVFPIIEQLAKDGYRIWYDEGIDPGSEWPEIIAQHLNDCSAFFAFITENSLNSHNCRREISFALLKRKLFLSIILEPVTMSPGIEMQLSATQSIFKYLLDNEYVFFKKIHNTKALNACLGAPNASVIISSSSEYVEEEASEKNRDPFSDWWFEQNAKNKQSIKSNKRVLLDDNSLEESSSSKIVHASTKKTEEVNLDINGGSKEDEQRKCASIKESEQQIDAVQIKRKDNTVNKNHKTIDASQFKLKSKKKKISLFAMFALIIILSIIGINFFNNNNVEILDEERTVIAGLNVASLNNVGIIADDMEVKIVDELTGETDTIFTESGTEILFDGIDLYFLHPSVGGVNNEVWHYNLNTQKLSFVFETNGLNAHLVHFNKDYIYYTDMHYGSETDYLSAYHSSETCYRYNLKNKEVEFLFDGIENSDGMKAIDYVEYVKSSNNEYLLYDSIGLYSYDILTDQICEIEKSGVDTFEYYRGTYNNKCYYSVCSNSSDFNSTYDYVYECNFDGTERKSIYCGEVSSDCSISNRSGILTRFVQDYDFSRGQLVYSCAGSSGRWYENDDEIRVNTSKIFDAVSKKTVTAMLSNEALYFLDNDKLLYWLPLTDGKVDIGCIVGWDNTFEYTMLPLCTLKEVNYDLCYLNSRGLYYFDFVKDGNTTVIQYKVNELKGVRGFELLAGT